RRSLEVQPDNCTGRRNLGRSLYELARYAEASAELERAIHCQNHAIAQRWLGRTRARLGDGAGARRAFEEALRIDRDYFDAWVDLGELEEAAGDLKAARAAFERALGTGAGKLAKSRLRARLDHMK